MRVRTLGSKIEGTQHHGLYAASWSGAHTLDITATMPSRKEQREREWKHAASACQKLDNMLMPKPKRPYPVESMSESETVTQTAESSSSQVRPELVSEIDKQQGEIDLAACGSSRTSSYDIGDFIGDCNSEKDVHLELRSLSPGQKYALLINTGPSAPSHLCVSSSTSWRM